MRNLLVWDAIIAWRDYILQKDVMRKSKIGYLSNMAKLIEIGVFDLEQPLSEFLKTHTDNLEKPIDKAHEWSLATKRSRRNLFYSFYAFTQQKKIKPTDIVIPFREFRDLQKVVISELLSSNEDKAKSQSLTFDDIRRFLREMCNLNPRDSLVCWMMWELKCTIHQILNLKTSDLDFHSGVVKLKDGFRLGALQQNLKQCIQMFIEGKHGLVFSTNKGTNVHPAQVVRNMKIASKRAKLPIIISPKILYAHAKAYSEKTFLAMSTDEREELYTLYTQQYKEVCEKAKNVL